MMLCDVSGRFEGTYRLHLQCGKKNIFCFHRGDYKDGMLHAVNILFADVYVKITAFLFRVKGNTVNSRLSGLMVGMEVTVNRKPG
jgi:hypothetical protein